MLHEIKFMPSGEVRILFVVPDAEADEVIKMRHAYSVGHPGDGGADLPRQEMNADEFEDVVARLLEAGVPPSAIAKAFDIDPFVVKDKLNEVRVGKYGAAELSEAMAALQWEAFEQAREMIYNAPHTVRSRAIMGILSKTMSLTARQNPETLGNMRADLLELLTEMAEPDDDFAGTDTGAFVAAEVDPSAKADEDQDQGSLGHPVGPRL